MSNGPRKLTGTLIIEDENGKSHSVTIGAEPQSAAARDFLSKFPPIELRRFDKCNAPIFLTDDVTITCESDEPEQN